MQQRNSSVIFEKIMVSIDERDWKTHERNEPLLPMLFMTPNDG